MKLVAAVLGRLSASAVACPSDPAPRAPGTLPAATLLQKQSVSGAGGATERSVTWSGVLLKDTLTAAGLFGPNDRRLPRLLQLGRAVQPPGQQVIVISAVDGRPLDTAAGPLALPALADLRPGPRHVRNLCALIVHPAVR